MRFSYKGDLPQGIKKWNEFGEITLKKKIHLLI